MTPWCRLWNEMPTDPKWRTIARAAGQPVSAVLSLYVLMLADASGNALKRGVTRITDENAASALDLDEKAVSAIRQAMQGRVLDGNYLSGWDARQPKREDNSYDRVAAYRERKRDGEESNEEMKRGETHCNKKKRLDTDKDTDKKEKEFCPKPRKSRVSYSDEFENYFWKQYPTDANMSKIRAWEQWQRLTVEDRAKAIRAVPHFVTHCRTRPDYRPIHAERWLSNRRFDGFAELADKLDALRSTANVAPIERPPPKPAQVAEPEFHRSPEVAAGFEKLSRSLG